MADPENIGIAVGIVLLLSVKAEIIVLPYLLPVKGRYLDTSIPFIRESVQFAVSQTKQNFEWLV